jgi:hypothetical protein
LRCAFARSANGGLIVTGSPLSFAHRDLIVTLAAKHKLPAVYWDRAPLASGGLISYGNDSIDLYRRAAGYVDRILKGEKPADLPVQAPTKYELVINLKTAKALGLDISPSQLQQTRPLRRLRQRRARPDRLPAREKNGRETVELNPERVLAACRRIELRGDSRGNAELGRAPVLRNVQIPRQRTADRWIVPNGQISQVAHGPAPWVYLYSGGAGVHLDAYRDACEPMRRDRCKPSTLVGQNELIA